MLKAKDTCFSKGLKVVLLTVVISNVASGYISGLFPLNSQCYVNFNYTLYRADREAVLNKTLEVLDNCLNNTALLKQKKNFTRLESVSCRLKCGQIALKHAGKDGQLSSNLEIGNLIKNVYEKYTNATQQYVEIIISKYVGCAEDAKSELARFQANGTSFGECAINLFYDECIHELEQSFRLRNVTKEYCPQYST